MAIHVLLEMPDGKVLDWQPTDGGWRLWNYDPAKSDILPGDPVASGVWSSITGGHALVVMADGHVLDWTPGDGSWRLWNYDAGNSSDILPGDPVASGTWSSINSGHALIAMPDGKVLDWVPADGSWRLWDYDAANTSDIFPGDPIGSGTWSSIKGGHMLLPMPDGKVVDWVVEDGSWRLWSYDPKKTDDVLPTQLAHGQWKTIGAGHYLIPLYGGRHEPSDAEQGGDPRIKAVTARAVMTHRPSPDDTKVLDWNSVDGSWRLWRYDPGSEDFLPGDPVQSGTWSSIVNEGSGGGEGGGAGLLPDMASQEVKDAITTTATTYGAAYGAAEGAAAGAAIGSVIGPEGTAIGALVGGIVGSEVGQAIGEAVADVATSAWDEFTDLF